MMTSYELRALLREEMAKAGFVKHAKAWLRNAGELIWLVELDRSPHGQHYSINIGVSIPEDSSGAVPDKANDCPILMHLENLPLTASRKIEDARFDDFRSSVILGFDLASDLDNQERRLLITSIIEALTDYINQVGGKRDLRARYEAGDLRSAFVSKDVRKLLTSDQEGQDR